MACRTASAIWTWPGRSAPPMPWTAAASNSSTSGTAWLTGGITRGTSERYLAPPSATTRRGVEQVATACHEPRSVDSCYDERGHTDGCLRADPGECARGGARADRRPAGGAHRAGRELDRLAGVAPDAGAGRPRGGRVRGAAGVDRVR